VQLRKEVADIACELKTTNQRVLRLPRKTHRKLFVLSDTKLSQLLSNLASVKTFEAFTEHWSDLPPAILKLPPYDAIKILLYY